MSTSPPPPADRGHLGRYRLEEAVARGGMGEIWRGTDTETGAAVAIKRLFVAGGGEAQMRELRARLVREARVLQHLAHENIVRYLDAGFDDAGQPYLVLEWLAGQDLACRQRAQPLGLGAVLEVARQTLRGLGACHAQGIVHRDVKPGNLFLVPRAADGEGFVVKLLDLGLARPGAEATQLTVAGTVMGTLHYLSPEQARGAADVDARTDLYAVGVILYQLCTGRLPFPGDQPVGVLLKIVTETPPRPRQITPELPPWLDDVITRAMQREPQDRYGTAEEMAAALAPMVGAGARAGRLRPPTGSLADTVSLARPTSSGEYRMVCLLCVQLVGAAPLSQRRIADAVTGEGGAFHALLGGQAVGIFGIDLTQGDEGRRALRAGLALRDAFGRGARLLVATTHVRVREGLRFEGGDLDRAMGPLATLPPGELVIDWGTRHLVERAVQLKRVGTHDAVATLRAEEPQRQVLGVQTPTVGRETELAALRAAFYRAADHGEAEGVLLVGPLGVGKTRLLHELQPELRQRSALCLVARADSARARTPYGLLAAAVGRGAGVHVGQAIATQREALSAFVAAHAPQQERAETAAFIGAAMGLSFEDVPGLAAARAEPRVMRERVSSAFESLLVAAAAQGPVALCLEDLQWADEESLQLCEGLLERLEHRPLFLLASARPELGERRPQLFEHRAVTLQELAPLPRRALRRLMRAVLRDEVAPQLEEQIALWSEGNPYLAEELLTWLSTSDALVLAEDGWQLRATAEELELPASVEGAIQGRLDRLPAAQKELLKAVSVFGEVFWEGACAALGFVDAAALLRGLEASQFAVRSAESQIAGTAEWAFRHPLVQQVAYGMLPREVRCPLHLRAARWLEEVGETDAAWLAHHFYEGDDAARAAAYSARAGERALADGDLERAAEHYRDSLLEGLAPRDRAERLLGLVRALLLLSRYDDAWQIADALAPLEQALPEVVRTRAAYHRGRIRYAQGAYGEAEGLLAGAAEAAARCGDAELVFDARHTLFWVMWVQGRYADASQLAVPLCAEARASARPDHLCAANLALAYARVIAGDHGAALGLAREAVELARQARHPFREVDALTLLSSAQEIVGQLEPAERSAQQALALARRLHNPFAQASTEGCLGRTLLARGEVAAALEHFERSIALAEGIGESRTLATSLAGQARALCQRAQRGDLQLAAISAQRALELAERRAPPVEAEALMTMAQVALASGDRDAAIEHAAAAVSLVERLGGQEQYEVQILLTAHDALAAAARGAEAAAMLARAAQRLAAQAAKIADPALRESFLQRVPENRRLRQLAATR